MKVVGHFTEQFLTIIDIVGFICLFKVTCFCMTN